MSGQYPPYNFIDENNRLTGFDVEICKAVAGEIGVAPAPLTTAWDGIIAGLLAGKYDLICGSMAITDKRLKAIDFSSPYYRSGAQLFVGRNADIDSAEQLRGGAVGVTLGTTYEEWVRANLPETEVRTYKGVPEMILEVVNGRIQGFVTDRIVGVIAIDEKKAPIRLAGPLLYEERMGIALRKGNPDLKEAIDAALDEIKARGDYRRISMKWLRMDAR
jgi:polar amino acid transport system substrate-binding protein